MNGFELHPRLAADTVTIGALPLSRVLLMNDRTFPWCILVPARDAIREIHELEAPDQLTLMREIVSVSAALHEDFSADKMNVAALGNVVPQLHVHVIVRFETDAAWPAPIWGRVPASPYSVPELEQRLSRLRAAFDSIAGFRAHL